MINERQLLFNRESFNPGANRDVKRCPKGFRFLGNCPVSDDDDSSNTEISKYRMNADDYMIFEDAYDEDGQLVEGSVAVFVKEESASETE